MYGASIKFSLALRAAEKQLGIDIYRILGGSASRRSIQWREQAKAKLRSDANIKELALILSAEFATDVSDDFVRRRRVEHQVLSWVRNGEVRQHIAREFFDRTGLSQPIGHQLKTEVDEEHPLI